MPQNNEASVEEILDSIKKVIARDNRSDALEAQRRRAETLPEVEPLPGIEPETQSESRIDVHEVLDLADMDVSEDIDDSEEAVASHSEDGAVDAPETPLVNEAARGAMQENLAALAMLAEPGAKPQIVRSGETSLEGLTRELLRPMLAEWLDKNLPDMVEKLVQAEIARIAGKRR
ncbi:MAG: DUF2497 domain-containing protein [Pseudomonadota bacterium]